MTHINIICWLGLIINQLSIYMNNRKYNITRAHYYIHIYRYRVRNLLKTTLNYSRFSGPKVSLMGESNVWRTRR